MWERLGSWQHPVETHAGSSIEFAAAIGLLDHPTLLAHVNYCDDAELEILAHGKASVVYCPRTHRYFGHPPHRWREMLTRCINVAVGTDSCASSPDLNIVDDLRLLHHLAPHFPVEQLWELITLRGAAALQMQNEIGSLTAGKAADFVIFRAREGEPLRNVLESDATPNEVWISGERHI
jgi:cytosine/adenosine deaminase-related metal-dependent hydrolase